jgi:hypothetical protein
VSLLDGARAQPSRPTRSELVTRSGRLGAGLFTLDSRAWCSYQWLGGEFTVIRRDRCSIECANRADRGMRTAHGRATT